MNPSYSTSAFTLQLPVVTASDDNLTISFRFNGKTEKPEHIAFYRATFVDKVKVTYQSKGGEKLFPVGKRVFRLWLVSKRRKSMGQRSFPYTRVLVR